MSLEVKTNVTGTRFVEPVPNAIVTEDDFNRYVEVQNEGRFNMLCDSIRAARRARLLDETYSTILAYYGDIKEAFLA